MAREHSRLISVLHERQGVIVEGYVTNEKPRWSRRAGGYEIAIDINIISPDAELIKDMKSVFATKHYFV